MIPLLTANDIEVKVKQVSEKGAVVLLYKTARVDMAILDKVYGCNGWQTDYKEIKGNLYCGIAIKNGDEWVWKWDCGIESREDSEGNQKKGEASDAFKRAGFKVGIGRELYTAPFIFLQIPVKDSGRKTQNGKPIYELADRFAYFSVSKIGYDKDNNITILEIINNKKEIVYTLGKTSKQAETKPTVWLMTEAQKAELESLGIDFPAMAKHYGVKDASQITSEQAEKTIQKRVGG